MIFYSIVYSLSDESNQYAYMFLLLLKSLIKTGSFDIKNDTYYLIADEDSAKKINQLNGISPIKCFVIPKPKTHLQGMSWKYRLNEVVDIEGKDCTYLDVDMLFIQQTLFFPAPNRLLAYQEGSAEDSNYAGNKKLELPMGCSAGIFAFNFGNNVKSFFEDILRQIKEAEEKNERFYTVEQPFFCHSLVKYKPIYMDNTLISFNGNTNRSTARIINLAGDPGDSMGHWDKQLSFFLQLF